MSLYMALFLLQSKKIGTFSFCVTINNCLFNLVYGCIMMYDFRNEFDNKTISQDTELHTYIRLMEAANYMKPHTTKILPMVIYSCSNAVLKSYLMIQDKYYVKSFTI